MRTQSAPVDRCRQSGCQHVCVCICKLADYLFTLRNWGPSVIGFNVQSGKWDSGQALAPANR